MAQEMKRIESEQVEDVEMKAREEVGDVAAVSFEDMNLREDVLRGVFAYGFETPSRIQQLAIKPACSGRDLIVQGEE